MEYGKERFWLVRTTGKTLLEKTKHLFQFTKFVSSMTRDVNVIVIIME